jgi:predicted Ser/Thr protein kinase
MGNVSLVHFEIGKSEIKFEEKVGKGSFGVVWKGLWRGGRVAISMNLNFIKV